MVHRKQRVGIDDAEDHGDKEDGLAMTITILNCNDFDNAELTSFDCHQLCQFVHDRACCSRNIDSAPSWDMCPVDTQVYLAPE